MAALMPCGNVGHAPITRVNWESTSGRRNDDCRGRTGGGRQAPEAAAALRPSLPAALRPSLPAALPNSGRPLPLSLPTPVSVSLTVTRSGAETAGSG